MSSGLSAVCWVTRPWVHVLRLGKWRRRRNAHMANCLIHWWPGAIITHFVVIIFHHGHYARNMPFYSKTALIVRRWVSHIWSPINRTHWSYVTVDRFVLFFSHFATCLSCGVQQWQQMPLELFYSPIWTETAKLKCPCCAKMERGGYPHAHMCAQWPGGWVTWCQSASQNITCTTVLLLCE